MTLNTTGTLLEGIRVSSGNNAFTYPPRSVITDQSAFSAVTKRAEYMVLIDFANPLTPETNPFNPTGLDIGSPNLRILWTKNGSTTTRFDYDSFSRRWNTMPGGPPDPLGVFGNSPRLMASVPDLSDSTAPFDLYVGNPHRLVTFHPILVSSASSFGNPSPGTVEISQADGALNFGSSDLANPVYIGQTVFQIRQSFFDRTKVSGSIGQIPISAASSYFLFMNPRPAQGQFPRIRIGFRPYLTPVEVASEASLGSPSAGTFTWSDDTGRIVLSPADVAAFPGEIVYYDGVVLATRSLARTNIGTSVVYPSPGGSIPLNLAADPSAFVLFVEPVGKPRSYFQNVSINTSSGFPLIPPASGTTYIDSATGNIYFSPSDASTIGVSPISYVQTQCLIENGASVQFSMSGVNVSGPDQVPDFTVKYAVVNQLIQDGLGLSPFVTLPTVPLVDSSLQYTVGPGPGSAGIFSGQLVDARDPSKLGTGYFLDLTKRQLSFTSRKRTTLILPKDQSMIKLQDSALIPDGFQVTKNGTPLVPGVDFDFNAAGGLMEFVTPVGENNPSNVLDISGVFGIESFTADQPDFNPSAVNNFLLVSSGPNAGIYKIRTISSAKVVHIYDTFPSQGSGTVDVRIGAEVLADRIWSDFNPPFKKISVSRGASSTSLNLLGTGDFTVLATTGQINLVKPAQPDELFRITYTSLDSPDNGVTVTPTSRTEFASFKIRQESAITRFGSPIVSINPRGKTIDITRSIKIYVDGVTQDSSSFTFTAPGSILLNQIITTQVVTVDYFVHEATGGESNFNLSFTPIDIDFPSIPASGPAVFNGNQTTLISPGTPFLVDRKNVHIASTVSYNSANDLTTVSFESPPASDSAGAPIQISLPVSGADFRVQETAPSNVFAKGTNTIVLTGNLPYSAGTIITFDKDPYLVQAVKHDSLSNTTILSTAAPALKNYIIPVITRTIRPVLDPGSTFNTSKPANLSYPFTLVKSGSSHGVLIQGVDYSVGDGGSISLNKPIQFGEALYALYVGRVSQPAGTSFTLNYAHSISPSSSNGLQGQRLFSTYNLYAPDTFFFRVETITSFIPEVVDELKKSAQSNGSSGPNIQSRPSLKTKDFGSPGLFFDEQHLGNLDVVSARMLQFYNDLANSYEDLLSDLDGRVVGGTSGKFRFDDNLNNPVRLSYSQITNDIDDKLKLFDSIQLTSLNPFSFANVPFIIPMWQPSFASRLFPTSKTVAVALNGNVGSANFGKTLGSLNQGNLTSTSVMTSAHALAKVLSVDSTRTVFTIDRNGDSSNLTPPFVTNAQIRVYGLDGTPDVLGKVVTISGGGPFVITLDTPATPGLIVGSLLQETSDASNTLNHFYTPGRDIGVNSENGQVFNITASLPALPNIQVPISGNEIMNVPLNYLNSDISPKRIPVLDGSTLTDSGRVSEPLLFRPNELDLLNQELASYFLFGNGAVQVGGTHVSNANVIPISGSTIQWVNGPNAGILSVVTNPITSNSFTLTSSISTDLVGSDYVITSLGRVPSSIISQEIGIISTNAATPAIPPSLIGSVAAQNAIVSLIALSFGQSVKSGSGIVTGNILTDVTANFSGVATSSLLFVGPGPNFGLYTIASASTNSIVVDPTPPFPGFSSSGVTSYSIIQPWSFLNTKEFSFVSSFIQQNVSYLASLQAWLNSMTTAQLPTRKLAISTRQAQISQFIQSIQGLLGKDDHIYDMRFLWIQQRVDRKQGTLTRQAQATTKRQEATAKLIADQQKLLAVSRLPQ